MHNLHTPYIPCNLRQPPLYPPVDQSHFQTYQGDGYFQQRPPPLHPNNTFLVGNSYHSFQQAPIQNLHIQPRPPVIPLMNGNNHMNQQHYYGWRQPARFVNNTNINIRFQNSHSSGQCGYGNNRNHSMNYGVGNDKNINDSSGEKGGRFRCEPCERDFVSEKAFADHNNQHKQCEEEGCTFTASSKIVKLHHIQNHAEGKFRIVLETPEDIAKWREDRKRNWPTPENIALKKKKLEQDKEDGIIVETKEFVYRDKEDTRARGKRGRGKKWRSRDNRGRKGDKNDIRHGEDRNEDSTMRDERRESDQLKAGCIEEDSVQGRMKTPASSCTAIESTEGKENIDDADVRASFLNGDSLPGGNFENENESSRNSSELMERVVNSKYSSNDQDSKNLSENKDRHSEAAVTCMSLERENDSNAGATHVSSDTSPVARRNRSGCEIDSLESKCGDLSNQSINQIVVNGVEGVEIEWEGKGGVEKEEGEIDSDEYPDKDISNIDIDFSKTGSNLDSIENKSNNEFKQDHSKDLLYHGKKSNEDSLHHGKKGNEKFKGKGKGIQEKSKTGNHFDPSLRKVSLLDMLLANEIRHERNVILQCVRYIVRSNFFDSN